MRAPLHSASEARDRVEERLAIETELASADALDPAELVERRGPALGHLDERAIRENDEGRDAFLPREAEPQLAQFPEQGGIGLVQSVEPRCLAPRTTLAARREGFDRTERDPLSPEQDRLAPLGEREAAMLLTCLHQRAGGEELADRARP